MRCLTRVVGGCCLRFDCPGDVSVGVVGAGTVDHRGFPVGYGGAGGLYLVGGVVLLVGSARVTSGPVVLGALCPCHQ